MEEQSKINLTDCCETVFFKRLDSDGKDAEYIFDFFSFFAKNDDYDKRKTCDRALRECIQKEWQEPRLQSGRYKIDLPWSKLARDIYFTRNVKYELRLEHVRPMIDVTNNLMHKIRKGAIKNSVDMLECLEAAHRGPVMVVITKEEDLKLVKFSGGNSMDIPICKIIEERYKNILSGNDFCPLKSDIRYSGKP